MNIISALKKKLEKEVVQEHLLDKQRKQFNMPININLINQIKKLTAEYGVPGYSLFEHIVQVGYFYVDKTEKSPKVRDIVRTHLIDQHLLDSSFSDSEELLRLGEGHYTSEVLAMSRTIIKQNRDLQRAFNHFKKTGNTEVFEQVKRQLFNSVVYFANWLSSHPLDKIEDEED